MRKANLSCCNNYMISCPISHNIVHFVLKDTNGHEILQHYFQTQNQVREQLVVKKDMDIKEHERLPNITHLDI
jgi:hypothetical protein